ncbi:cell division protein FtsQ/DivIB [Glacieibacterium frigidum]|uniref:Cell division protein FtsQ n=1 Tax=Glacieibacterium frigidum TaxID=2593303 RepID=A0A552UG08_9SPHN|nr:FtsQ-type POTRA domain-containing protein [Glacieibacterium frigidum]TRW17158.1 FtsQ-type POTRA domain-containing protein [Glacieibacterium frigidum]
MTRTVQRRGAKRPPARKAVKVAAPQPRLVTLPIAPRRLYTRVASALVVLLVIAGGVTATLLGYPQRWWQNTAIATADAGFEVRHVEIEGIRHMPRLPVYTAALAGGTNAMLLVDLPAVRDRLKALPWVADASVARRLPDTLVVEVVERRPVALWQYRQRLVAIDASGKVLDNQRLERFGALPLVVGRGANLQAHGLVRHLSDQPALARRMTAALLVGGRRWDIRFDTGETLALPEGDRATQLALTQFATLDRASGLLAKGFTRFDMRAGGKMTVRGPGVREALANSPKMAEAIKI